MISQKRLNLYGHRMWQHDDLDVLWSELKVKGQVENHFILGSKSV